MKSVTARAVSAPSPPPLIRVDPDSHAELRELFAEVEYDFHTLERGVPRLILETLPEDLATLRDIGEKKRVFLLSLLPLALVANKEITADRQRLLELTKRLERGFPLAKSQRIWLEELAFDYGITHDVVEDPRALGELIKRVDVIPPSLILAQAANESAWGTSRFAREGNNLFGEWTFRPGTGIVPRNRPPGETYEVRRFANLLDSVRSYLSNLNTHRAYRQLREARAKIRQSDLPLQGSDLVAHLEAYSSRGIDYIRDLRALMRQNRLAMFSEAGLRGSS